MISLVGSELWGLTKNRRGLLPVEVLSHNDQVPAGYCNVPDRPTHQFRKAENLDQTALPESVVEPQRCVVALWLTDSSSGRILDSSLIHNKLQA